MAYNRRTSSAIRVDASARLPESPPGIAALFLIRFDIRAGYTIAWKRSLPEVELQDFVEFKSLPSGAHNVKEDLVYFVLDEYAGISAFVNQPAAAANRNALMLAVGVLVPLSHGRLGKSWRHAANIKELALKLADNPDDTEKLEDYWENYQLPNYENPSPPESPLDSIASLKAKQASRPGNQQRNRALSDATALMTSKQVLAPFHPALCLPDFIGAFGPSIFPLYRAALLRKRILFVGDAPIETACNYVYGLSLLSSLPQSLLPCLPSDSSPSLRPKPLFNVGVHDMTYLSSLSHKSPASGETSWIACTSDRVLGLKPDLYDVLVELLPAYSNHAPEKIYPKLIFSSLQPTSSKNSQPIHLKASQRDARRYMTLREGLRTFPRTEAAAAPLDENSDNESTFSSNSIVEPLSWPLLAYTSFIWWASAGEKGAQSDEERDDDARLLAPDDDSYNPAYPIMSGRRSSISFPDQGGRSQEVALITYFRRLTSQIFTILFDIVSREDESESGYDPEGAIHLQDDDSPSQSNQGYRDDPDEHSAPISASEEANEPLLPSSSGGNSGTLGGDDETISISTSDITQMGLDPWSDADRAFVEELVRVWWGRKAQVYGPRIQCCGVRII